MGLPEIETMERTTLASLQFERLAACLRHAHDNVDHYQQAFGAADVKPEDLSALADIRHFPFTLKNDLRDNYPFGMFAVAREKVVRIHASSGTTGKSTIVGYTNQDLDMWAKLMARCLATMGVRPGDIFHNCNGYGLFTGGLGFHDGAQCLGATVVPVSGGNTKRQIQLLVDFGAHAIAATPSYALHIAETAQGQGIDLASGPLRVGCFGAEAWSEEMRCELQTRLGIVACDMYGLSEIIGPGVACECREAQDGLHGWEDHFLFEIIDPETGAPLPDGDVGELVITSLTKQALPMIRYRTGDMTSLDHTPCICGRTHVRLKRVAGRSDDMLTIRGVNLFPSQVEAALVGFAGLAPYYVLVIERVGAMDSLTVEVEADGENPEDTNGDLAAAAKARLKDLVGVTAEIIIKPPGTLPRSQGKAARVRDLRNQGQNPLIK